MKNRLLLQFACSIGFLTVIFGCIINTGSGSPQDGSKSNEIIAYFPLNSNADDLSENNFNGEVYGAIPTKDRNDSLNGAFYFDGIDDYIVSNSLKFDSNSIDKRTITVWIKPDSIQSSQFSNIISKHSGPQNVELLLRIRSGYLSTELTTGDTLINFYEDSANLIEPVYNEWQFLSVVYDSMNIKMYLNGILIHSKKGDGKIPISDLPFTIGARAYNPTQELFKGSIDEIHVYRRDLSDIEILELFQNR